MALKPCKSCKHQIDAKAKTCPSCGVSNPGVTAAQQLMGLVLLLVIVVFAVKACTGGSEKSASVESQKPAVAKVVVKTLGVTPKQYAERINPILKKYEKPYRVDGGAVTVGEVNDIFNANLGPYASLIGSVSKANGEIQEITLIGAGDGKPISGLEIMMMASAALAAAAPEADYKEVFKKLPSMLEGKPEVYGDVKLSVKQSDQVGTWFFATPI
ncbi:hypothetical protein [Pseudomonas sp. EMN2]|uniref:hypothetical protein n=1 Tax=Pseudomonas sp. EMN2 TaxID=2615212 RepID=UPI00129BAC0D|nr:hypothetical protein [Pseudomonas sp. EMN2]